MEATPSPPVPSRAIPVKIQVSSPEDPPMDFSGQAREFMQHEAMSAPPDLTAFVSDHVRNAKGLGDCVPSADDNQAYLVDLDGDGEREGVSTYSLENCGAPDNVTRSIMVSRRGKDGAWITVLDAAMSVKAGDKRPIIRMGDGKITLAPETDGFGQMGSPEILEIPETALTRD